MPARPLPNNPSLEHLKKQAKRLRDAVIAGETDALAQVAEFHPRASAPGASLALSDAQFVVARSYGFASWAKLKRHLAAIEPFVWNPPPAPDPNSPVDTFIRLTCLTYAGWHRSNPEKARRLLAEHPELAWTSIYTAAAVGDVTAVRAALDRDPRVLNAKGGPLQWEPLLYACYSRLDLPEHGWSTLAVARLLLSRGADPNAGFLFEGSYAFTALTGAFGRGEDWMNQPPHAESEALARMLLEAGADPNDSQALYNRHFQDNDDHLKILFDYGLGRGTGGPWLERLNHRSCTPSSLLAVELCAAASRDFFDRVKLLVEHGVDVNTPGARNKRTPYEEAVRDGHHHIAEYLLQHGAKKIELDARELFALACIAGRREEARARLAQDPSLLERLGHYGRMEMLHRAVDAKNRDGIRFIAELGVDINGMVPGTGLDRAVLHNAAGWGGVEMVRFLIELGADRELRDLAYHATPHGWARHCQQRDVVDYLLPTANIVDAVQSGGVERVTELLRLNPGLVTSAGEGGLPLVCHLYPEVNRLKEMLDLLIAHGADLNAPIRGGRTMLDAAIAHGWIEFAEMLRRHGARESGRDE
jgi:ankyrin repeat protein